MASISTAKSEVDWWPMFQHDPNHSGFSSSEVPVTNETLWVFDIGALAGGPVASVGFAPAVVDGRVFVGSSHRFWCINSSSGLMIWNYSKPADQSTSPAISNGRVLISGGQELFCFNVANGDLLWTFARGSDIRSSPVIKDGRVFVGSGDGLYCVNLATGELLWNFGPGNIESSPTVVGTKVFLARASFEELVCLDAESGTQLWASSRLEHLDRSSPMFYDGRVFVGTSFLNNTLFCFDSSTGALLWKYQTEGWIEATPAVANGKVFIGDWTNTGIVYCLNAQDGTLLWKHTYEGVFGAEYSSPAVADGKIVLCMGRKLFVLNETNGDVIWSYEPPVIGHDASQSYGFYGTSVAIAEGRIYATTQEGSLYCFGPKLFYTITIDPEFVDNIGKPFTPKPVSCTFLFSNGTQVNASLPATFLAPLGSFSIVSVVWRDVEVLKREVSTYLDSNTIWKPRVQCVLPTDLEIKLESETSLIGFRVDITGNIACNGLGLTDIPILLSFSVTNGETWNEITQVSTSSEGNYSATWIPVATGNYLVKADWVGNSTYPASTSVISLGVIPSDEENVFAVVSNSTISSLTFESDNRELKFVVSGLEDTEGYVEVTIAKSLIANIEAVEVKLNNTEIEYATSSIDDSWLLSFAYPHSSHTITINLKVASQSVFGLSFMDLAIIGIAIAIICVVAAFLVSKRRRAAEKSAN
ncbi:MAG: PQQ-binding-like beta-propeller repeat protein [Candidatus Bathyarchaeota archaeon]|nr:PQQ-binding-like beta-propeller repeat protein [Candidatus Bathyarchaeota archaeon]